MGKVHSLLLVAALSWCITGVPAQAQTQVGGDIDILKFAWCQSPAQYEIEFELWVETDQQVKKAVIEVPERGSLDFVNNHRLNDFDFSLIARNLSRREFRRRFPAGRYKMTLFPLGTGMVRVDVVHRFPALPVITYPACGDGVDPSLPLTITWEPLSPLPKNLYIWIDCEDGVELGAVLPPDADSFTVQPGALGNGTECDIELEAENDDGRGNDRSSVREVFFLTSP